MHSKPALIALIAIIAMSTAGCQKELTAGPVVLGGDPSTLCVPAKSGGRVLVGEVLEAPKTQPIEITAVNLTDTHNAELIRAYVVPIGKEGALGSVDYPVDDAVFPSWSQRKDVKGATVKAGESVSIALVLKRTSASAKSTAAPVAVEYKADGTSYKAIGSISFELKGACT